MDKRWILVDGNDYDPTASGRFEGGIIRTVYPINSAKFSWERDLSTGLIAFRKKLTTDLVFNSRDFEYFHAIQKRRQRRCEELTILRQYKCAGAWRTVWAGTFSTGSGRWDLTNCLFTVRPEVLDKYTCILKALNKKVNILELAATEVQAVIWPSTLEVVALDMSVYPPLPFPQPTDAGYVQVDTQTVTRPAMGSVCTTPANILMTIFWREYVETPCVDGVEVPPPGTGWIQDPIASVTCVGDGVSGWVRNPTISWPWPNDPLVVGPGAVGDIQEPTSPDCFNWIRVGLFQCPGQFAAGIFICTDNADDFVTLGRGRKLIDASEYILSKTDCGLDTIVSDFFEWDPPGDAPGYSSGVNYVTGETNQVDQLFILQKSDAIDPDATNPATKGEMTLKELFAFYSTAFQVFWDIDSEGRLRLEHWLYWTYPVGLDFADFSTNEKTEPMAYDHLANEIPQIERPKWSEALGEDFVGADIVYSGPCVGEDQQVKEYSLGRITTDLSFVIGNPDEINKDGFVVLATLYDGVDYSVILDDGALSGTLNTNAPMSWANLERDFWTWNRYLPSGNMNEADTEFDGTVSNIEQKGAMLAICCELLGFNPSQRVATALGKELGGFTAINAFVQRAELNEATNWITLTLRYSY